MRKDPLYFIRSLERLTQTYGWVANGVGVYITLGEDEAYTLAKKLSSLEISFDVQHIGQETCFQVVYQ